MPRLSHAASNRSGRMPPPAIMPRALQESDVDVFMFFNLTPNAAFLQPSYLRGDGAQRRGGSVFWLAEGIFVFCAGKLNDLLNIGIISKFLGDQINPLVHSAVFAEQAVKGTL